MNKMSITAQKEVIKAIAFCYREEKRKMEEYRNGYFHPTEDALRGMDYCTGRIEIIVKYLDEDDRLIIFNEVILGRTGSWYLEYMSKPTYYRLRKKAYRSFLHCLEGK